MMNLASLSLLTAVVILSAATTSDAQADKRVLLDHAMIVTRSDEPSFIQYGIQDLARYLKELTGDQVPVVTSADNTTGMRIVVGTDSVKKLFPQSIPGEDLGSEGYVLRAASKDGADYVLATGSTPRGTKIALGLLMKKIQSERTSAFVPAGLDVSGKPAFAKRGMHFNGWAINYPYTFRSWTEEDWQRYLDMLSYQGVNLFYLWPFIEIMPVPLSPEDEAYLEECRRVVDYAQKKHGMEVWLMQCTNRVAKDRCGVADPRQRPYWRPSQEDLNPGNPEHFKAIMASREAMYRIINNADGVCNIDSDPGFLAEGTFDDYNKVLLGCRALLDRHNLNGKQTKLINWMLWGWGRKEKIQLEGLMDHQRLALRALIEGGPLPLWLISGQFPEYLPMVRDEGLISRTVYLPYGIIEREPGYPVTNVEIDAVRGMFNGPDAKFPGLAGIMGNVQTPLLQFPNLFYFTSSMCDSNYANVSEKDVLLEVSGHLFPDHRQLLADSYLALKEDDPVKIEELVAQLDKIVQNDTFGRPGVFGRKLFPNHRIVAESVLLQLRMRAAHRRLLAGVTSTTPKAECEKLLCDYLEAYLAWDTTHGWHNIFGWQAWQLAAFPYGAIAGELRKNLSTDSEVNDFFAEVAASLSATYDADIVRQGCIEPFKSAVFAAKPEETEVK